MIWGGRWERGSGVGTYVHPWWIHVDVWQNQYSIVKLKKNKIKKPQYSENEKKKVYFILKTSFTKDTLH